MQLTIETHTEYPEDGFLSLPAIDFSVSTSSRTKGMLRANLIHSPSSAETWTSHGDRETLLTDMVGTLIKRLLTTEEADKGRAFATEPVAMHLHVYMVD